MAKKEIKKKPGVLKMFEIFENLIAAASSENPKPKKAKKKVVKKKIAKKKVAKNKVAKKKK